MTHYIIYRITNKINGNYYIGQHITQNLNDGYMGSGKLILRAIKKYGIENFVKEYLHFCESEKQLNILEEQLVITNDQDPNSYNLIKGGNKPPIAKKGRKCKRPKFSNGYNYTHKPETIEAIRKWTIENQPMNNPESRKKLSEARKGMKFSEEHKKNLSLAHKGQISPNKGKKMSAAAKEKMLRTRSLKNWKWKLDPITNKRIYFSEKNKDGNN